MPSKGTSLFYNLFQHKLTFIKIPPYQKWEADLGKNYTTSQWQSAYTAIYKASKCVNHWELSQKIALRWYLTPYQISKFSQTNSWRECSDVGNIMHVFWSCKHLTSFWNSIFRQVSSITGILTPLDPGMAVLNLGVEIFPLCFLTVVTHVS